MPKDKFIMPKDKSCIECGAKKATYMKKINALICPDCRKSDKYTFISKSHAKKTYFLDDEDFDNMKPHHHKSSYGTPATYYTREDLIAYACDLHNVEEKDLEDYLNNMIVEKEDNIQKKKIARHEKIQKKMNDRKSKLEKELKKKGLVIRKDSKLCKLYINGSNDFSL
ncbi:MAG: hypothetical protein EBQ92_12605, partial [Proteobacteria bacterium]|nr:hypothetical protein [Pseudomonadota bacterium]